MSLPLDVMDIGGWERVFSQGDFCRVTAQNTDARHIKELYCLPIRSNSYTRIRRLRLFLYRQWPNLSGGSIVVTLRQSETTAGLCGAQQSLR